MAERFGLRPSRRPAAVQDRERGTHWGRGRFLSDDGSATVTACLALATLVVLTVLVMHVGGVVAARHRAQTTADLAALAAAAELPEGAEAGCAAAELIGRRMNTAGILCEVAGWDVLITVEEKVPVGPFGARSIRAIARAGPVEEQR